MRWTWDGTAEGGWIVADEWGLAWGEGDSFIEAFADWQISARDILSVVDAAESVAPALARKAAGVRSLGTMLGT
jgi:hypothetical protein